MTAAAVLAPTSMYATSSPASLFVKNTSDFFDNAEANQAADYEDLTLTWSTETRSEGSVGTVGTGATAVNYVLKKTFYIKSTGDTAWSHNLVIDEVTATAATAATAGSGTGSANLNKSLRVLVVAKSGSATNAFVYAPFTTSTMSYNYKGTATGAQAVSAVASTTDSTCTNITSIPITGSDPITIEMYMYFEGEDANCKSSNISGISVDTLTVSAKFKTTAGPADA